MEETIHSKRKWRMRFKKPIPLLKRIGTKHLWRLILIIGLWVHIIKCKYIALDTMEKWFRKPIK